MKKRFTSVLILALLGSLPSPAQRNRRPAKAKGEDTGPVQVTRSATLRVSIASDAVGIFEFLADSKKLEQWFPDQAIIEPKVGGKYHFRWKDAEGVWSGMVTQYIRGNALGFTWQPPGQDYETNVLFKLSPEGAQTTLELTHSGFTSHEAMDMVVKAWVFYLQNLKSVVEWGADMRQSVRQRPARRPTRTRRPGA